MTRRFRRSWQVLAAVAVALGLTAGFTTSAQAAVDYFELFNQKANKCMSLDNGGSTTNGTNVVIYDCNNSLEQTWYRVESKEFPGYYYIKNYKAGPDQCISVSGGGSTANGAEMILWTCTGAKEQRWWFLDEGSDWYDLQNHKSGKYMSLANGGGTHNNTKVIQWEWVLTGFEQVWGIVR